MKATVEQDLAAVRAFLMRAVDVIEAHGARGDPHSVSRGAAEHLVDRVLIRKAAEVTGYSVKAIEIKIERGVWVEGPRVVQRARRPPVDQPRGLSGVD